MRYPYDTSYRDGQSLLRYPGTRIVYGILMLALLLAFSSSLMMSLTHYGTGTAPIIFGSGYTTLNEWWGAGAAMSVVNLLILVVVGTAWWKLLGYI